MSFGTLGFVCHRIGKMFCDYNHGSLMSVPEADDLACILNWRWNKSHQLFIHVLNSLLLHKDSGGLRSHTLYQSMQKMFTCCFTRTEAKPTGFFPIHWVLVVWFWISLLKLGECFWRTTNLSKNAVFWRSDLQNWVQLGKQIYLAGKEIESIHKNITETFHVFLWKLYICSMCDII